MDEPLSLDQYAKIIRRPDINDAQRVLAASALLGDGATTERIAARLAWTMGRAERALNEARQLGWMMRGGWTCHVCGERRDDLEIAVYSESFRIYGCEVRFNVRHCFDRSACVEGAPEIMRRWRESSRSTERARGG